ncbi:PASTA domain-containing protein [Aliiglaciecola sp. CAU 1673]|uniref:PASTA domain-containing protein n=1 Tax=Aliiglaciecola sp. CAU 1673 TaxID=3032595 RepID=UPI0023DAF163|nr:PASTA domain-containing protein [Aliiglaciecola sp. CAU 1673]MDF2177427.1 PASTA domain-containing protein [Aliiglaciecola sp. CAU 1673]
MNSIRTIRSLLLTSFTLLLLLLSAAHTAQAQQVLASDCNLGFKNVFQDNEPVCATGTAGGSFFGPSGLVCVVPPGAAPTNANDVTAGGCNSTGGFPGSFFDLILWLPPLAVGNYDIVVVNNQGGSARDSIAVLSSGGAPPTVDVAAIKAAAGAQAAAWQNTADWGANLSNNATAIAIAWAAATGDWVSVGVNVAGAVLGVPTDYNGAVLQQGGQIIAALAGGQAAKYKTLENDPPDPLFMEFIPIDIGAVNSDLAGQASLYPGVSLTYPFNAATADPLDQVSIALANSIAEEQALVFSLTRTLEKFQGAEAANDDLFTFLQAQELKKYADILADKLTTTKQVAMDYKAELAAKGLANLVYDGADIAALNTRLINSGLTPAEEQSLRDSGFGDADIVFLFDRINAFPAPTGTYSRGGGIDSIVGAIDTFLPAVQQLGVQAQDVVDHFAPLVTSGHPTADPGGPYIGDEGQTFNLDGSGSSDPTGQALTFAWDLDLDGLFDDAFGSNVSPVFNTPLVGKIGLLVTDTDGNEDIAYADLQVLEVNGPPQIMSFVPATLTPTASNLNPLSFSANASDPDADPLSFEWRLDNVVVSTDPSWIFTPGLGDSGSAIVKLTVTDANALSPDAIETRFVQIVDEVLVPDVVGLPQADAETAITAARLVVGTVSTAQDPVVPAGDVISQTPLSGSQAQAGDSVDLTVSLGPTPVPVPDVVGLSQADAEAAIVAAGLTVGTVSTANSAVVPAGDVISQNPTGGTVLPGSPVDLVISDGPLLVNVPDVTGLSQAAAETTIVDAGLTVGAVTTANSSSVPAGNVISQNPTSGLVAEGTPVDLTVSLGSLLITVPDVTGLPQATAEANIVGAGLTVGAVSTANSSTVPAGNVISQTPGGGAQATAGSAVDLVVSIGVTQVSTPDVIGLLQADAEAAITGAGLAVGIVTTEYSAVVPTGVVINQTPSGGSLVAPGSDMDLIVSAGVQGDIDGDGDVDRDDLGLILDARNQPATGPEDPRDLDGDGVITVLDARMLMLMCSRPRCAVN